LLLHGSAIGNRYRQSGPHKIRRKTVNGYRKEREYIWHDGDVDELIVQIDKTGTPYYAIQDANLNVTAYVNFNTVVQRQIQYDPYGRVIETDAFGQTHLHPVLRVGFQGLFTDRLETDPTRQPLEPEAPVLIHARNRTYHPRLGRWLTAEPRGMGSPLIEAAAMQGLPPFPIRLEVDLPRQYRDGPNAYEFVGSNPITRIDPLGDSWVARGSLIYSLTGLPYYTLPAAAGYALGAYWGYRSGMGADDLTGVGHLWWNQFRPYYFEGTEEGLAKYLAFDVAPEVATKIWPGLVSKAKTLARRFAGEAGLGPVATLGAPMLFLAGYYAGIIDSVVYAVDSDMSGGSNPYDW
jgi:hypothetical protein